MSKINRLDKDLSNPNSRRPAAFDGEDWNGHLPDGWDVSPLKFAANINPEQLDEKTDPEFSFQYIDISSVDSRGQITPPEEGMISFEASPSRARRRVRAGDTIVATVRTYLKAIAFIDSSDFNQVASTGFAVLRPQRGIEPRFLWRFAQSEQFVHYVVRDSVGVSYPAISPWKLGRLPVPVPPLADQRNIADFLDRETAKIDSLIEKKKRLIELLEEKRSALITQAVTKGLDPDVPMKDSGVRWIGEIPAHWRVRRLKYLALSSSSGIQMGPFGSMLKEVVGSETGYKLYGQENTISGDFSKGSRWISREQYKAFHQYTLEAGDIVVTRKGSIGNASLVPADITPGIIDSDTVRIRVDQNVIDSTFLALLLHTAWYIHQQIESVRRGAVLAGLNTATIVNLIIIVPPCQEQIVLSRQLSDLQAGLDSLARRVQEAIELLAEYRTALISAAVTGKIDVRERAS